MLFWTVEVLCWLALIGWAIVKLLDRLIGNVEAFVFRQGGKVEGYKTQAAVVLGSVFTLLAAFGVGFSPEQQSAIVQFMAIAGWPALMWVMRYFTRGPIKLPRIR